ncbi:hypothetical protein DSO57_1002859 [Entomophthora muscae]|uniref:Uncharacterized protein n=1 Tax=Entomophthora muscae TaxID=34485 RepID=A0ACC2TW84_9FUNG|nr:hypothetical protein DSO57_1002859 [Entomophthora muscae]
MFAMYSTENLRDRVLADSQAFDQLINTIPAKYYISEFTQEAEPVTKYTYGKRKNTVDEAKKKALMHKKIKFDPSAPKTVELLESRNKAKLQEGSSDDESLDSEVESDDDSEVEADDEDPEPETEGLTGILEDEEFTPSTRVKQPVKVRAFSETSQIELKQKLSERIAAQRKIRKADDPKKKQEFKNRRENRKNKKIKAKTIAANKGTSQAVPEKVVIEEDFLHEKKAPKAKTAATINDSGALTFAKFEFSGVQKKKKGPSNAHSLLQKVEAERKKIAELKATDAEKAKAFMEKKAWTKALQQSSGEKVKDDPKLLKKTIKRLEKKKTKSSGEWVDRKTKVREDEAEKQAKRTQNLQQRIDAKKNKKMGIKKKPAPKGKKPASNGKKSGSKPKK